MNDVLYGPEPPGQHRQIHSTPPPSCMTTRNATTLRYVRSHKNHPRRPMKKLLILPLAAAPPPPVTLSILRKSP
jgi:hypothetical protein